MRMKVKDLAKGTMLHGKKLRTPKGVIGYYASEGNCTVMLSNTPEVKMPEEAKGHETRLYPQIVEKNSDVLEWDVVDNDDIIVNCDSLTSHKYTMNVKD